MPRLVWFRNDLRTLENPALDAAAMSTEASVLGVFFLSPTQWKLHGWGAPRVSFMLEHLRLVRHELEHRGIPLLIQTVEYYSDMPAAVLDVMEVHGCTQLDANIEYGLDEQRRDAAVMHTLRSSNMDLTLHEDQTIIPCNDFRTGGANPYRVYTPFRKKWEQLFAEQSLPACAPKSPKRRLSFESGSIPNTIAGFEPWPQQTMWTPGTDAALHRLSNFLDGPVDIYHRNRDRPDLEGTSSLSPWLAVGAISPISCMCPLVARHGPDPRTWPEGPRTWQSELVWRDFYRHVMWNYPAVSMHKPMKSWTENVDWQHNKEHFAAWCEGRTGIDFVDAAMRQLQATGWMHNRMRMITAMFLTKNLLIDWRRGEEFFAQHLIDYDFASNNGGWQWAASTGTDAAPYFRIFNPERQSEVFDPDGTYRTRWLIDRPPCEAIVDPKASRANAIATFKQARELNHSSAD